MVYNLPMSQEKIFVLFDIDQTLLSRVANGSHDMFQNVFNLDASEDDVEHTGRTERHIITEVIRLFAPHLLPLSEASFQTTYQAWAEATSIEVQANPPEVLPGIKELISLLQSQSQVVIGLLTGNATPRAEAKLKAAGIDHYFRHESGQLIGAFGHEAVDRADLIKVFCEKYGVTPEQIVIVDDSVVGAVMAEELGVYAILLATGTASEEQLKNITQNVFPNLDDGHAAMVAELITS